MLGGDCTRLRFTVQSTRPSSFIGLSSEFSLGLFFSSVIVFILFISRLNLGMILHQAAALFASADYCGWGGSRLIHEHRVCELFVGYLSDLNAMSWADHFFLVDFMSV